MFDRTKSVRWGEQTLFVLFGVNYLIVNRLQGNLFASVR